LVSVDSFLREKQKSYEERAETFSKALAPVSIALSMARSLLAAT